MSSSRQGLTLIEVLVAAAILSAATLAISVLWRRGVDILDSTEEKTQGVLIAQSVLARVEAGSIDLAPLADAPLAPGWTIDVEVEDGPVAGTEAVTVFVRRAGPRARMNVPVRVAKILPSRD